MSVTLLWKPTDPARWNSFGGGSNLADVLSNAFGEYPVTLRNSAEFIFKLEGMVACGFKEAQELIYAIEEHGSIDISADY